MVVRGDDIIEACDDSVADDINDKIDVIQIFDPTNTIQPWAFGDTIIYANIEIWQYAFKDVDNIIVGSCTINSMTLCMNNWH